ncbi:MAG: hypothetical protein ABI547_05070 [Betaproteobacteria bacterium]
MTHAARWCAIAGTCAALLYPIAATAAPSTLLPPECAGKTGAALDQCVRDLTAPTGVDVFEPIEAKPDPRTLLNCNLLISADQGFCIARNEIILECRKPGKYPDFGACVSRLISRQQQPRIADCSRAAAGRQNACALRNKHLPECLKDPWLYFMCLGEKTYPK